MSDCVYDPDGVQCQCLLTLMELLRNYAIYECPRLKAWTTAISVEDQTATTLYTDPTTWVFSLLLCPVDGLVGLVCLESGRSGGFESHLQQDFSGLSHRCDLEIGTPVATVPGAWHYRVSTGVGWPGVSILCLGEVERVDLQLLSQCGSTYNCLSRSVPEIH